MPMTLRQQRKKKALLRGLRYTDAPEVHLRISDILELVPLSILEASKALKNDPRYTEETLVEKKKTREPENHGYVRVDRERMLQLIIDHPAPQKAEGPSSESWNE